LRRHFDNVAKRQRVPRSDDVSVDSYSAGDDPLL